MPRTDPADRRPVRSRPRADTPSPAGTPAPTAPAAVDALPGQVTAEEPFLYELTLRSAAYAMAPVRRIVRDRVRAWAPDRAELADAVALLVTELLTNAYLNSGPTAECRLELRMAPNRVRLTVEDPHPALPTRRRLGLWDEAGRSMRLLDGLAARWGAEPVPAPDGAARGARPRPSADPGSGHTAVPAGKRVWAELDARA